MSDDRPVLENRVLLLPPTARDGEASRRLLIANGIDCVLCANITSLCQAAAAGAAALIIPEETVLTDAVDILSHFLRPQPVWSDMPVIVLSRTGAESPAVERAVATLGNVTVIERPVRVSTLLSAVRTALRARTRQYEVRDHLVVQRKNELVLRETADRLDRQSRLFDAVASTTLDFAYVFDLEGRLLYANKRMLEVLGVTSARAIGKSLRDVGYEPWHADMHLREIAEVIATRKPLRGEVPFTGGSGIFGVYEYIFTPVLDANDRVEFVAGTTRDVTERRAAEEAARRLAEQRRLALDAAQLGWWQYHPASQSVQWDLRVRSIYGLTDEFLPYEQVLSLLHPEDRAKVDEAVRASIDPVNPVPYSVEYRVRRSDGAYRWVASKGIAHFEGSTTGRRLATFVGTALDITDAKFAEDALRESESKLRQLADSMPQIVWAAKPDGELDYYNRRWFEYVDLPEDSIEAVRWDRYLHPDDLPAARAAWAASVTSGEPYGTEFRVRRADGAFRWFLVRARPITGVDGKIVRWFGTCTDIDEQRNLQDLYAQLLDSERAARAEAERAGRMKDEFLATLSHELRTPLNAIMGWSHIINHGPPDPEKLARGLDVIERNARAQTQIIEDLLDMSRIISGKVRLDVQAMDLSSILKSSIEAARPAAEAKGVQLLSILDPLQGITITGDPNRTQQIVWNLLSNATKFTPRGGSIQVLLQRVDSHVEIRVIDTGEGIKPEFLPYVFDRFRQADASTTRRHGGLGLGLSIVKQLVELHGGSISVSSGGNQKGTTFVVSLPITAVHTPRELDVKQNRPARIASPVSPIRENCGEMKGVRVLVVDDEPDARSLVTRLLEDCHAVVTMAGSATEAISLLEREAFDVLVSDIGMPSEDGYAFIRKVRALANLDGTNLPAVALTAYARPDDRAKSMLAGFQVHLAKPVEPAELIAVVASLAGRAG